MACFNPRAPCGARPVIESCVFVCRTRFNPRAPCGARPRWCAVLDKRSWFQSTRPVRGATVLPPQAPLQYAVSIHAPRAGRDTVLQAEADVMQSFNPRAPCGARQFTKCYLLHYDCRFNPRAPCGARRDSRGKLVKIHRVSIHAPRAGRDMREKLEIKVKTCFNPRAPCGARQRRNSKNNCTAKFQSTRPVRGATKLCWQSRQGRHVSIHAPRAGRDKMASSRELG